MMVWKCESLVGHVIVLHKLSLSHFWTCYILVRDYVQ